MSSTSSIGGYVTALKSSKHPLRWQVVAIVLLPTLIISIVLVFISQRLEAGLWQELCFNLAIVVLGFAIANVFLETAFDFARRMPTEHERQMEDLLASTREAQILHREFMDGIRKDLDDAFR